MKPTPKRIPSVVVIQERHVRHGENFKIFKVSCRSRREYITKFMSSRRTTYRCKSRKVRIGCMLKETTYKGSPLAISRLLLLDGLDSTFPTFEHLRMDTCRSSPTMSYFNLSDRSRLGQPSSRATFSYSVKDLIGSPETSTRGMVDMTAEKTCTPGSIPDFDLIFGSDTNEGEDLWSDDDNEKLNVVLVDPGPASTKKTEGTGNGVTSTLARMEKEIKKLTNAFEGFKNQSLPDPQLLQKIPTIPLPSKKSHQYLGGNQNSSHQMAQSSSREGSHVLRSKNLDGNANHLHSSSSGSLKGLRDIMEPSGCIPFFRIPGGCFLVVHAANQTTPLLHATFVTGTTNTIQFQQTNLPVYGSHQVVAVHLGPYQLTREEIQGVFTFACGTRGYDSSNTGRSK